MSRKVPALIIICVLIALTVAVCSYAPEGGYATLDDSDTGTTAADGRPETEPRTEAETSEIPGTTEAPAETEPDALEDEPEPVYEFTCVLETLPEYYLVMDFLDPDIVRDGDHYLFTGKMAYRGSVSIAWEQKALLDAGAVMRVVYEDKEIARVTAEIVDGFNVHTYKNEVHVEYTEVSSIEEDAKMYGYFIPYSESSQGFRWGDGYPGPDVYWTIEEEVTVAVPAGAPCVPAYYLGYIVPWMDTDDEMPGTGDESHEWTLEEFIEVGTAYGEKQLPDLRWERRPSALGYVTSEVWIIREEDGKVVEISNCYTP